MTEQNDYNNQTDEPITIQFEESADFEDDNFKDDNFEDDYEEDFDDEEGKVPPLVMAGVFLGLVVLAAIICGVLWSFTHKDNEKEQLVNATETIQDISAETESQQNAAQENTTSENAALEDSSSKDSTSENTAPNLAVGNETSENEMQGGDNAKAQTAGNAVGEDEDGVKSSQSVNEPDSGNQEAIGGKQVDDTVAEDAGQEPISGNETMEFTKVSETVTAKDVTNLRSVPSTLDAENVVSQLLNGETLSRTGINDATGWSRLDYNGQTVYAVTGYLTTDLTYKPPVAAANPNRITTQDGRVIIFTDCDDYITPKEYVNLRVEPSTSQGDATAKCQISNGTVAHRTGYSPDSGWSRVEYNGEVLYVVSSMVYNTDAVTE